MNLDNTALREINQHKETNALRLHRYETPRVVILLEMENRMVGVG